MFTFCIDILNQSNKYQNVPVHMLLFNSYFIEHEQQKLQNDLLSVLVFFLTIFGHSCPCEKLCLYIKIWPTEFHFNTPPLMECYILTGREQKQTSFAPCYFPQERKKKYICIYKLLWLHNLNFCNSSSNNSPAACPPTQEAFSAGRLHNYLNCSKHLTLWFASP